MGSALASLCLALAVVLGEGGRVFVLFIQSTSVPFVCVVGFGFGVLLDVVAAES